MVQQAGTQHRSEGASPGGGDAAKGSSPALFGFAALLVVLFLSRGWVTAFIQDRDALATWLTVFVSIAVQSTPFLVLGVVISSAIAVFVPLRAITKVLPSSTVGAVPAAGLAGALIPGCECASVPIAGALVQRGLRPAVALTFLLAAPAINPIVLVSTAVAFPGRPEVVVARFLASLLVAVSVGWAWLALGKDAVIRMPRRPVTSGTRTARFVKEAQHDLLQAGGFLVIGGAVAASVNVLVPSAWLETLGGNLAISVVVLACFAVVIAICSEADAFVAASLTQFPLTARLAFMVVGPVLDVKLFSMQVGTFGRRFAVRFAPLTFVIAVSVATVTGLVLL